MGIPERSQLDLIEKVKYWFSLSGSGLSCFSRKFEMPMASSTMCFGCENTFSAVCSRYHCQGCRKVWCGNCAGGHTSASAAMNGMMKVTENANIKSCNFCSGNSRDYGGRRRYDEKIYPSSSPQETPGLPSHHFISGKFDDNLIRDLVEVDCSARFPDGQSDDFPSSSSAAMFTSMSRSDGEEGGDSEKHLFCSSNEYSYDTLDFDTSSVSARNEFYNYKSVSSSPSDSPYRINFTPFRIWHPVQQEQKESPKCQDCSRFSRESGAVLKMPETDVEDPGSDDLPELKGELQHLQMPVDFGSNSCIWFPPPPDNEDDEAESSFFSYDDEDDDIGESSAMFTSSSSLSNVSASKVKPDTVNKGPPTAVVQGHFRALLSQLLQGEGFTLDGENGAEKWLNIVTKIAWEAANFVKTDACRGGSMDPGDYVKVKCVASGSPDESTLVKGVVCTKNIKHKRMTSQYKNPRLFLLGGALEYQKVPNQLASFDTLLQQEIDHLKMIVSKIEARRPNVILVEKSVSSHAQEYLLAKEISLVLNVKRALMQRIARCTGAVISPSIDNISTTRLGNCDLFRVERVSEELEVSNQSTKKPSKTLMFFEGCPRRLGCTVLLRGACCEELKKVKHVVQYAVFAAYHLSLETSFLADEGASLPKKSMKSTVGMITDNVISSMSNSSGITTSQTRAAFVVLDEGPKEHGECGSFSENFSSSISPPPTTSIGYRVENALSGAQSDSLMSNTELLDSMTEEGQQPLEINEMEKHEIIDENEVSNEYLSAADCHQHILVAFSSYRLNGTVCERSSLLRIKFYGCFDKPLGRYLHDDLFGQTSYCRYCNEPAESHVRCYIHQQGILTIHVRRLPSLNLPGERDGKIWMWHRCLRCSPTDGIPPATHRVVMSNAAWGLSFGKFLELSFSNHTTANRVAGCGHSLQRDCLRFYGLGNMVAVFGYSPINILSVHLPPPILEFNGHAHLEWVHKEAAELISNMEALYREISEALSKIEQKNEASKTREPHNYIMELRDLLKAEKDYYGAVLRSVGTENSQSGPMMDFLELNRLRHALLIGSHAWDRWLYVLDSLAKTRTESGNYADVHYRGGDLDLKDGNIDRPGQDATGSNSELSEGPKVSQLNPSFLPSDRTLMMGHQEIKEMQLDTDLLADNDFKERIDATSLSDKIDSVWTGRNQPMMKSLGVSATQTSGSQMVSGTQIIPMRNPSFKRFTSRARVFSFDSALRNRERIEKGLTQVSSFGSFHASGDYKNMIRDPVPNALKTDTSASLTLGSSPSRISCLSRLTEGVHLLLPRTELNDLVIAVYDDEPASMISYALSSKEHEDWVVDNPNEHSGGGKEGSIASTFSGWQSFGSSDVDYIQYGGYGSENFTSSVSTLFKDLDKSQHLRISYSDDSLNGGGKVKFLVMCYFVKQFDALRKICCPSEVDFVCSLSRCRRWRAEGGKSKVYFARSLDERFIIKQVTKTELESFEEFAPQYFKYMAHSVNTRSPTCLARILGIYQVSVKHAKGGKETKMDLMVMENLFFNRNITRVYDLKGSSRSRYNADTTGENKVLLDMNLLETLRTEPIFLGSKAKRNLERAVWNDTSFLAGAHVMDYSLLVGVDEERKELVVGIIDYMRQYTWDKHLETWVKASGILGGPRNAPPTIISPDQYKRRFRKAMTTYFLTVTDQLSP